MTDSYIQKGAGGTTFVGPDAVSLYRAVCLAQALSLHQKGLTLTRGFTKTRALQMASRYTGKPYKRTELAQAEVDVRVWVETMKAAMPIVDAVRPA